MAPDLRTVQRTVHKIYVQPKLKWYQKVLQFLHIKNYWTELEGTVGITNE